VNQCQNPLERGSRLKPDGYGLGQAVSAVLVLIEGCGPVGVANALRRVCDAWPRERHGRPAGQEPGRRSRQANGSERGNPTGAADVRFGGQARRSVR
jgi:hypothetical protein